MASSDLVRMANDIAANFRYLGTEKAAASVANHIRMFWAPAMRTELLELARGAGTPLDPVVIAACQVLKTS